MKKNWIFFLCLLAFISCSKKLPKGDFTIQEGKLLVGLEVGYPPFEYYDKDGSTIIGLDPIMITEIGKRMGLEVKLIDTAWDGIFAGLNTDRYDVVCSACTVTPERQAAFDFSIPYIGNSQSIIVRKDSALNIKEFKDIHDLNIGYQAECTSDFYTKEQAKINGFTYTESAYDKIMNAYDDLRLGRINCVVSDYLVAVDYLNAQFSPFKCVWQGNPDEHFAICVKKGNTVLKDKLNECLEAMIEDGTMKKLYLDIFKTDLSSSIGGK